ncbi:MAG: diaminopimelate decarboxylase [bacterium]
MEKREEIIRRAVEKYGTPLFFYEEGKIREQCRKLREAFAGQSVEIFYAMKANSRQKILQIIREEGVGIEATTAGEIYRALSAGFPPEAIIFNGNGKTPFEVEYAIKKGITFLNFDSLDQWELIHFTAKKLGKKVSVLMRLNPGIEAGGHSSWATGAVYAKFGLRLREVEEAIPLTRQFSFAPIVGLHSHFGTQVLDVSPFLQNARFLKKMRERLKDAGIEANILDLGGGLGVVYHEEETPFHLKEYAEGLRDIFAGDNVRIFLEPGRFLVAEAGILLTRVVSVKQTGEKNFVVADAGMTENPRPMLYGAYHPIRILARASHTQTFGEKPAGRWDVVGPVCENDDYLGKDRELDTPQVGDLLQVGVCGAYCASMGSNYNSRVSPAEVLWNGTELLLIRPRQTFKEMAKY